MNIWCPNVQFYHATQRHRCCNVQFTGYSSTARALVDIPEVNVLLAQDLQPLWHCVIKRHILESPFIVISSKNTCALIMFSTQHLDMPHLSGGCINLVKKGSLTWIWPNLYSKSERNDFFGVFKNSLESFTSTCEKWEQKLFSCLLRQSWLMIG